ncbi:NYN domain-containing protein [Sphingomonas sp. LHG3406-1]|uniref:NYN domain-containing protein n=1 Tax=Sphingomonas sp. LHG3406-1 TaxID=2804617 RepID=UPI0026333AF6|nr:NYN domain-containing protein [Sphingomonas sp. LHG3406-1]
MDRDRNIALLIDADNASPDHLDEVLLVLGELGAINVRRAYGNWSKPALKGWGQLTTQHSIQPIQQFDVVKGKSATDMRMVIDAMDMLYRGKLEGLGIMSSDSDFLPLAQRIREAGIPVYGFGTAKTPISFQNSCTRFFDVAALAAAENGEPADPEHEARAVEEELLHVLGAAWKQSKRDDDGFASLSEVGQRAKAVLSFSVRNYGARSLSELVRTMPEFQVKEIDGGGLLVRRVR